MEKIFNVYQAASIRLKLMAAFLVIIILTIIVSAISWLGMGKLTSDVNVMFTTNVLQASLAKNAQLAALDMRNSEKEYLLTFKELGFEKARQEHVSAIKQHSVEIDTGMDGLEVLLADEHMLTLVRNVRESNNAFLAIFVNTVQLIENRGFKDSGLEGVFRSKAHAIEAAITTLKSDRLEADMLMVRRHEKDYLLRGDSQYIDKVGEAIDALKTDIRNKLGNTRERMNLEQLADEYLDNFQELVDADSNIAVQTTTYRNAITAMEPMLVEVMHTADNGQTKSMQAMEDNTNVSKDVIGAIAIAAVALGLLIAFVLAGSISKPIIAITALVRKIANGSLDESLDITGQDELGLLSKSMHEMQFKLKCIIQNEIQVIINQAGDGNLSDRIKTDDKSGFYQELATSINALLSVNEQFLNDTANTVSNLADGKLDLENRHVFRGKFASVQIDIERMRDNFVQVISRDIQAIVRQASAGDLSGKVELQGKTGFYRELSEGINTLVDTSNAVINDCIRVTSALAKGSFDEKFACQYHGNFAHLQEHVEKMRDNLKQTIEQDIQGLVRAAANGNLKQRIDLVDKAGFYKTLSASINDLVETNDRILTDTSRVIGSIAKGDLTQSISAKYQGTFDQLKQDINKTVVELTNTVKGIQHAASCVDTGASEISNGNVSLSQRTEDQAGSLEETAAAMEEMTATVRQTSANANKASQLSKDSIAIAVNGEEVVNQAISSMALIRSSSNQIVEIVSVINEIAFQTNLLALNASVEAARAGEQGKGFAVVANEVRMLAGRCAKATSEIKELIQTSSMNVEAGSELTNRSGAALKEIIASVRKVDLFISEISISCDDQSTGIEEINVSLTQMDAMTQQNAALVEEAAAASDSLKSQSRELNAMVRFFRIEDKHMSYESRIRAVAHPGKR